MNICLPCLFIFFSEHDITPTIFYQLKTEDLRILCPSIGHRFRLEQEQIRKVPTSSKSIEVKKTLVDNEMKV